MHVSINVRIIHSKLSPQHTVPSVNQMTTTKRFWVTFVYGDTSDCGHIRSFASILGVLGLKCHVPTVSQLLNMSSLYSVFIAAAGDTTLILSVWDGEARVAAHCRCVTW